MEFLENPQKDGPYGARGLGEHGILGIPSAIANALYLASKGELDELPLSPETIWKTVEEALVIFKRLDGENKKPLYYGGGTEIISMARMSNIVTGGVIDLKGLDELNILEVKDDKLAIGSANNLRKVIDSDYFPLLDQT